LVGEISVFLFEKLYVQRRGFLMSVLHRIKESQQKVNKLKGDDLLKELSRLSNLKKMYEDEIVDYLFNGGTTFKSMTLNQEGIVTKSSKKEGFYQFTYFDDKGAIGDIERDCLKSLAKKINQMDFKICKINKLKILN